MLNSRAKTAFILLMESSRLCIWTGKVNSQNALLCVCCSFKSTASFCCEQIAEKLKKEMAEFEKQRADELKRLEEFKAEEKKKLR